MDTKKVFYLLIALGIVHNLFLIKPITKKQVIMKVTDLDSPVVLIDPN